MAARTTRLLAVLALALAALLAGCGGEEESPAPDSAASGSGLERTDLTIYSAKDAQMAAQILVAQDQGYFKEEGIEKVDLQFYEAGSEIPQGVASGDIKIGAAGWVNPMLLATSDFDTDILAITSDLAGNLGFVAREGVEINSPKDFEGKKMGLLQVGILNEALARLGEKYGVDVSKIQLVNGAPSETLVAFQRGDVDVLFTFEPFLSRAVEAGGEIVLTGTSNSFGGNEEEVRNYFGYGTLFADAKFTEENPNTMEAFLRAFKKGNDFLISNQEESAAILSPTLGLDKALLGDVLENNAYDSIAFTDEFFQVYEELGQFLTKIGELKTEPPPIEEFVNLEPMRKAAPDLVQVAE